MAFIMGYGLTLLPSKKLAVAILVVVGIEGLAAQIYDFRMRQPYKAFADLEGIMDTISNRDDRIAINTETHNPTPMYFAHRSGWCATNSTLSDFSFLNDIRMKGCKYIVVVKQMYGDLIIDFPIVYDSEYFKIYDIKNR